MILKKKVSMGIGFAQKKKYEYQGVQYEADVKDGDIITILNDGTVIQGQYGEQHVFKIKTRNGEKALALNQASINNLVGFYGEDTTKWIDKDVKVWAIKAMVAGKMQTIIYISDVSDEMDEDGNFEGINSNQTNRQDEELEAMPDIDFDI